MSNDLSTFTGSQHITTLELWLEVCLGLLPCRELPRSQTRSWAASTGAFFVLDQQRPRAEGAPFQGPSCPRGGWGISEQK